MKEDRNQVFSNFIKENPSFANPEGHHRRLADWEFDTKHRTAVDAGEISYEAALKASRDAAIRMLPAPQEKPQTVTGLTGYDAAIAEMAIGRNQPIPAPANRTEEPPGLVAQICARNSGLKIEED